MYGDHDKTPRKQSTTHRRNRLLSVNYVQVSKYHVAKQSINIVWLPDDLLCLPTKPLAASSTGSATRFLYSVTQPLNKLAVEHIVVAFYREKMPPYTPETLDDVSA